MNRLLKCFLVLCLAFCAVTGNAQSITAKENSNAEYPDGEKALLNSIVDSIEYTANAMFKNGYYVSFTVNKEGKVDGVAINKKRKAELSADELAVYHSVNKLLRWTPAYENGKPVERKFAFNICISFQD